MSKCNSTWFMEGGKKKRKKVQGAMNKIMWINKHGKMDTFCISVGDFEAPKATKQLDYYISLNDANYRTFERSGTSMF